MKGLLVRTIEEKAVKNRQLRLLSIKWEAPRLTTNGVCPIQGMIFLTQLIT